MTANIVRNDSIEIRNTWNDGYIQVQDSDELATYYVSPDELTELLEERVSDLDSTVAKENW